MAFLLMWLCNYVFYVGYLNITKDFVPIDEMLANEEHAETWASGSIILGHLYSGLASIVK